MLLLFLFELLQNNHFSLNSSLSLQHKHSLPFLVLVLHCNELLKPPHIHMCIHFDQSILPPIHVNFYINFRLDEIKFHLMKIVLYYIRLLYSRLFFTSFSLSPCTNIQSFLLLLLLIPSIRTHTHTYIYIRSCFRLLLGSIYL